MNRKIIISLCIASLLCVGGISVIALSSDNANDYEDYSMLGNIGDDNTYYLEAGKPFSKVLYYYFAGLTVLEINSKPAWLNIIDMPYQALGLKEFYVNGVAPSAGEYTLVLMGNGHITMPNGYPAHYTIYPTFHFIVLDVEPDDELPWDDPFGDGTIVIPPEYPEPPKPPSYNDNDNGSFFSDELDYRIIVIAIVVIVCVFLVAGGRKS